MKILLMSRFNTVYRHTASGRAVRKMETRRFSKDWMKDRISLMKRYTAPSVADQTNKSFDWYVFVQAGTPDWVLDEIRDMGANTVIVANDDAESAQLIARQNRGWIATVNLDTDDAISRDFIQCVHENLQEKNETFAFLRGMRHRDEPGLDLWSFGFKSETNPFQVLVEKASEAKTVFDRIHGKVDRVIDTGHPMWLIVIHGDNLDNHRLERSKRDKNDVSSISKHFSTNMTRGYGRGVNRR